MRIGRLALALFALACVILSLMNASWIAGRPTGALVLIAHRGMIQPFDRNAAGCTARAIHQSEHLFLENTLFSMQSATHYGADGLMLDVRASSDGQAMVFRDADLGCRTNGSGALADRPLAYLKQLDVGYGYSPDGGHNFPFRGRGVGGMPTVDEVIRAFPRTRLIYALADARAADALVAAYARSGVEIGETVGFTGDAAALARLRQLTRSGWTFDPRASAACLAAYRRIGWLGVVPGPCRGATLSLPRSGGWSLWGWPYRFMDRLQGAGAHFLIAGDNMDGMLAGLDDPDQLGDVPHDYAGMLIVEDMYGTGRALQR